MIKQTFFMALVSKSDADAAPNKELGFDAQTRDFGLGEEKQDVIRSPFKVQ
jgi:hypothetical protein